MPHSRRTSPRRCRSSSTRRATERAADWEVTAKAARGVGRAGEAGPHAAPAETDALGLRLVTELLAAHRHPGHRAAFHDDKGRHALVVRASRRRVTLPATRTCARPGRPRAGRGTRRDGDRGRVRSKLEASLGEVLIGTLILEEDDLTEAFPADLETHADLGHGRIADIGTLSVHVAIAVGAAHDECTLANAGEHSIAVRHRRKKQHFASTSSWLSW